LVAGEDLEEYVRGLVASARKGWERDHEQGQERSLKAYAPAPMAAISQPSARPTEQEAPPPPPMRRQPTGRPDVDDMEWRKMVEELARLNAEKEFRQQLDAAAAAQKELEERKRAEEEELRQRYLEEGMLMAWANMKPQSTMGRLFAGKS
jgi:hypothetical protein